LYVEIMARVLRRFERISEAKRNEQRPLSARYGCRRTLLYHEKTARSNSWV